MDNLLTKLDEIREMNQKDRIDLLDMLIDSELNNVPKFVSTKQCPVNLLYNEGCSITRIHEIFNISIWVLHILLNNKTEYSYTSDDIITIRHESAAQILQDFKRTQKDPSLASSEHNNNAQIATINAKDTSTKKRDILADEYISEFIESQEDSMIQIDIIYNQYREWLQDSIHIYTKVALTQRLLNHFTGARKRRIGSRGKRNWYLTNIIFADHKDVDKENQNINNQKKSIIQEQEYLVPLDNNNEQIATVSVHSRISSATKYISECLQYKQCSFISTNDTYNQYAQWVKNDKYICSRIEFATQIFAHFPK